MRVRGRTRRLGAAEVASKVDDRWVRLMLTWTDAREGFLTKLNPVGRRRLTANRDDGDHDSAALGVGACTWSNGEGSGVRARG